MKKKELISQFVRIGICIEFDNLESHYLFQKAGLEREQKDFEQFVAKNTAKLSEEEKEDFYEWHSEQAWRTYDVLPSLHAMATFMLAYGTFEKALNDLCRTAGSESKFQLKDISGQGIERAKTYLSKAFSVDAPFNSPEWEEVTRLAKIRNVMAHALGELDLSNQNHRAAYSLCKNDPNIKLKGDASDLYAEIALTHEFSIRAIKSLKSFLLLVCSQ